MEHVRTVLASFLFADSLFLAHHTGTKAYLDLSIFSSARAVLGKGRRQCLQSYGDC